MKVFILLAIAFAYVQAESEPVTVQQLAVQALTKCIKDTGFDAKEIMKNDILPEDNADFSKFFVCYWTEAGVIKDETFNDLYIKVSYPYLIVARYPNVSETDAQKLASDAVDHCKDVAKSSDSIGLRGIKYRNCMMKYVIDKQ